jgi:hypothetical protein
MCDTFFFFLSQNQLCSLEKYPAPASLQRRSISSAARPRLSGCTRCWIPPRITGTTRRAQRMWYFRDFLIFFGSVGAFLTSLSLLTPLIVARCFVASLIFFFNFRRYASLLQRWNLLEARAEIMKAVVRGHPETGPQPFVVRSSGRLLNWRFALLRYFFFVRCHLSLNRTR